MDFINDSIPRLMLKMAVPASMGFFFNTMYNVVDTYWGGRLSTETLAALSLSFAIFFIIVAIGNGISTGTTALVANLLGSGHERQAIHCYAQAIVFGLGASLISSLVLLILLPPILSLFHPTPILMTTASNYIRVIIGGAVFFVMNNVLNSALAARGDTKSFRNFLIIGFFLNLGLDPLFMSGLQIGTVQVIPEMRESGIALATVLIQVIGVGYIWWKVIRTGTFPPLKKAFFRPDRKLIVEILSQSMPPTLNYVTVALGTFVINFFISRFGTDAIAAYGAGIRIEQIALVPAIGLNVALTTVVGQNNGAGRMDRVWKSFRMALLLGFAIMVSVYTPVLIFGRRLLGLFTSDGAVLEIGLSYLYIQAITYYSYILLFQCNSLLQGIKKPAVIFWVGLYRQIAAPAVIFSLFSYWWAVNGVWWGLVVVNWSAALFLFWRVTRQFRIQFLKA